MDPLNPRVFNRYHNFCEDYRNSLSWNSLEYELKNAGLMDHHRAYQNYKCKKAAESALFSSDKFPAPAEIVIDLSDSRTQEELVNHLWVIQEQVPSEVRSRFGLDQRLSIGRLLDLHHRACNERNRNNGSRIESEIALCESLIGTWAKMMRPDQQPEKQFNIPSLKALFYPSEFSKPEVCEAVASFDLDQNASTYFLALLTRESTQKITNQTQWQAKWMGDQIENLETYVGDTRSEVQQLKDMTMRMAIIVQSLKKERPQSLISSRERIKQFQEIETAFDTLSKIGGNAKCKPLMYMGKAGAAVTGIIRNVGLLTGGFNFTKVVGMAAINPALGVVSGLFTLGSLMFLQDDKQSEDMIQIFSKQISELHGDMVNRFNKTWENQQQIMENQRKIYEFLSVDFLPLMSHMQKKILHELKEVGKDLRERLNRNFFRDVKNLCETSIPNLENVDPGILNGKANKCLLSVGSWLKETYEKTVTLNQIDEISKLSLFGSIQYFAEEAYKFGGQSWDSNINRSEVVNIDFFNRLLFAFRDLQPYKNHLNQRELGEVKKRFGELAENTKRFIEYLRTSRPLYEAVMRKYTENEDNIQRRIMRRFVELRNQGVEVFPKTVGEAFSEQRGQNIEFHKLLEENNRLIQLVFGFCFLSATFHEEIIRMTHSEEVLASPFDYQTEPARYPLGLSQGNGWERTVTVSTKSGTKVLSVFFNRGSLHIYEYLPFQGKWESFFVKKSNFSENHTGSFKVDHIELKREGYLCISAVGITGIQLHMIDLKTKKDMFYACPRGKYSRTHQSAKVVSSHIISNEEGDNFKGYFFIKDCDTVQGKYRDPKCPSKGRWSSLNPKMVMVSFDFTSKSWSNSQVLNGFGSDDHWCRTYLVKEEENVLYFCDREERSIRIRGFSLESSTFIQPTKISIPNGVVCVSVGLTSNKKILITGYNEKNQLLNWLFDPSSKRITPFDPIPIPKVGGQISKPTIIRAKIVKSLGQDHLYVPIAASSRRDGSGLYFLRVNLGEPHIEVIPSRMFFPFNELVGNPRSRDFDLNVLSEGPLRIAVVTFLYKNALIGNAAALEPGIEVRKMAEMNDWDHFRDHLMDGSERLNFWYEKVIDVIQGFDS